MKRALVAVAALAAVSIHGQVVLTTLGTAYTQDFDTLDNSAGSTTSTALPTGWAISESGGGARDNEQYGVDTGSSNTGDTYSYGAAGSTERALGGLQSGTLIPTFGVQILNSTGADITEYAISYVGELWRTGTANRTDQLDFQYSLDATSLTTGTWVDVNPLDFVSASQTSTGAKDGNTLATAISSSITGISVANGSTIWIRWSDANASGADDGLAVDNVSVTPVSAIPEPSTYALIFGAITLGVVAVRRRFLR